MKEERKGILDSGIGLSLMREEVLKGKLCAVTSDGQVHGVGEGSGGKVLH